jgi:glucose/arabinose dehydrogenase
MVSLKSALTTLLLLNTGVVLAQPNDVQEVLKHLSLPAGFVISIYADKLPNARSMALGDDGVLFVGTVKEGKVYAVLDANHDGVADKSYIIAKDLYMPNGVAYKNGALYVAAVNRLLRFDVINQHLDNPPAPVVVTDKLPDDRHHGWKYLRFGSDNKLYTAVGAPCNICDPEKDIYTSLIRLNSDGSDLEILARGIRNTVGFDWQPETNALFFNDNGRDYLGDDEPADELNLWSAKGEHFGYPYCHAGDTLDPEFGKDKKCANYVPPVWKYKAHIAPLGMRFYTGQSFPAEYKNQLLVAQHGSWNRTEPQGYQVALVKFKDGKPVAEQSFISGWLTDKGEVLGRPVDILTLPNGSVLISDDQLGVIYKVTYTISK